jgi:hypothetical protein
MLSRIKSPSSITVEAAGQLPSLPRRSNSARTAVLLRSRISRRLGIVVNAQTFRQVSARLEGERTSTIRTGLLTSYSSVSYRVQVTARSGIRKFSLARTRGTIPGGRDDRAGASSVGQVVADQAPKFELQRAVGSAGGCHSDGFAIDELPPRLTRRVPGQELGHVQSVGRLEH